MNFEVYIGCHVIRPKDCTKFSEMEQSAAELQNKDLELAGGPLVCHGRWISILLLTPLTDSYRTLLLTFQI